MKRTGFKRKEPQPFKPPDRQTFERNQEAKKRVGLKRKAKRPTVAEGSKYLEACRGEECYLRVPRICISADWAHESVVDCHSNQSKHGKAGAMKAQHIFTVPGCARCHEYIDRGPAPRDEKFAIWDAAYAEWEPVRARKMGLVEQQEMEAA
jgi:hypothetical protein